jgi:two-component system osmolarity sensor histidine kinase EnvZ
MRRDIEEMSTQIGQAVELGSTMGAGERTREDVATLVGEVVGNRPRIIWRALGRCIHSVNAQALRRILGNLIENALRYSSEPVEVRLDCRHQTPSIVVLDRGPGIPQDERDAVFRPFYRLEHSRNRRTGGSGLGLAIARQLAVANEMEIELSPRDQGGLIARILLPPARAGDDTEAVH